MFSCLVVRFARSRAIRSPIIVTARAVNLSCKGIVKTGVFKRLMLYTSRKPPKMLPQARRFKGLITAGLFSLIGERGRNRGVPIVTKYTTRKL